METGGRGGKGAQSTTNSQNPVSNFSANRRAWYGFVAGLGFLPSRLVRVCAVAPGTGLCFLSGIALILLQSMGAVAAFWARKPSHLLRVCVAKTQPPGHPFFQKRTSIFAFPGAAGEPAAADPSRVSVVGRRAHCSGRLMFLFLFLPLCLSLSVCCTFSVAFAITTAIDATTTSPCYFYSKVPCYYYHY